MSGLGRQIASIVQRPDSWEYDDTWEGDADLMTEDDAREQADDELMFDPGVLRDAINEICGRKDKSPTLAELQSTSWDHADETTGRLLVFMFHGSLDNRVMATTELRDRIRAHLDSEIKQLAKDKLDAQQRFLESLNEGDAP